MKKLNPETIDYILQYYKSKDCRYFVLKMDDLFNSMYEQDYFDFDRILKQMGEYRAEKGKGDNYYFVLNRDEYEMFKKGDDFVETMEAVFKGRSQREALDAFLLHCPYFTQDEREIIMEIVKLRN